MMKRFALIGSAGYIADRHMKAIKETGNDLVCASDRFDVMGRIDSYFPEAEFFLEFEKLEQYFDLLRRRNQPIDYVSICTPNYLHAAHIQFALKNGADAICEKPLVLYPEELDILSQVEKETGKKVFNILQLRLHPAIQALKSRFVQQDGPRQDIDLTYITSRGKWYHQSWKSDVAKSGGIATNIGIHFFDMLIWIFGPVQRQELHWYAADKAAGYLELENARVRWFLSLDSNDLPAAARQKGMRTFRSITIGGEEIEFSEGFTDLHTATYRDILSRGGFGLDDAAPCILLTHQIRNLQPAGLTGEYHPFLLKKGC